MEKPFRRRIGIANAASVNREGNSTKGLHANSQQLSEVDTIDQKRDLTPVALEFSL